MQDENIKEFRFLLDVLNKCQEDRKIARKINLVYNVDFNIVHPQLWPKRNQNDASYKQYDQVANNIIHLHSINSQTNDFSLLFTTFSIWELLDSLAHNFTKVRLVQQDPNIYESIVRKVDTWVKNDWNQIAEGGTEAWKILDELRFALESIAPAELSGRLDRLFGSDGILQRSEEEHALRKLRDQGDRFRERCNNLLKFMEQERTPGDSRQYRDRRFHYKVDCANIAISEMIDSIDPNSHTQFVCSAKVRRFVPRRLSVNPTSLLLHAYVNHLSNTHFDGDKEIVTRDVQKDGDAFLEEMRRDICHCIKILQDFSITDLRGLPPPFRQTLNITRHRYFEVLVRPINASPTKQLEDVEDRLLRIVSSQEEFKRHGEQAQADIREAVGKVINLRPTITSSRLLEDAGMDDDPRLAEIFNQFGLDK